MGDVQADRAPNDADVGAFFTAFAAAHGREDVEAYLEHFEADAVWVTSRGVCYRGRDAVGDYLRQVMPGGLGGGGVRYVVESIHHLAPGTRLVVVEQAYLDSAGAPRDERACHTHSYVLVAGTAPGDALRIAAGQNTVRA
jgi:uncharacterized protein (TIGR02246 family)